MNTGMPTLFISHGAPDIILSAHPAVEAMRTLPARFPRPRAVVTVSAHWIDEPIGITVGDVLPTIHDFGGFPRSLYAIQYPARGDDALSKRIQERLHDRGMDSELRGHRGLDHGTWIPLRLMYPGADIPVVQVSLPAGSLDDIVRLGRALSDLRRDDVLVIGSGGSVHNLRVLKVNGGTDDWVMQFEDWLLDSIEGNRFEHLIKPEHFPPIFRQAHPGIEHYAPLIFAWAAAGPERPGRRIHHSVSLGNLGMAVYEFD